MKEAIERAHALADGALSPAEAEQARREAAADPRLQAEHDWARTLKAELAKSPPPTPDPHLWTAVRDRLDAIDRSRTAEGFVGRYAWAFCAVFLLFIVAGAITSRLDGARPLATSQVAGLFSGLTPVAAGSPDQAVELVREKVGYAPTRMVGAPVRVLGAAYGLIDGRRAARIVMADGVGEVLLFVVERTNTVEGIPYAAKGYMAGSINRTPALAWCEGGDLVMLVGPRDHGELQTLAEQIRSAQ